PYVGAAHAIGDLARDPRTLGQPQGAARDEVGERGAVHQLHHDRARSAEILEAVDGRDVRVVDRCEQPRLTLEAGITLGAGEPGFGQHLDGDVTTQPRVRRAINLAHPARAEQRDDLVRTDSGSRCDGHGRVTLPQGDSFRVYRPGDRPGPSLDL